jgi:hypothetical protein
MSSSRNKVCKRKKESIPSWMFLCNKMNNSENTNAQIRKYAKDEGIDIKGKSRNALCRELAKSYDKKIKIETVETVSITEELKKKLAKLINNSENGYSNYFTIIDINYWLEEKSSYDYHGILYYVRKFTIVKKNKKTQKELYDFKDFPNLSEMLKLLIGSIEVIPISDRQKYALFLKKLFTEQEEEKPIDENEDIGEFYQYDYENEYDVLRSA